MGVIVGGNQKKRRRVIITCLTEHENAKEYFERTGKRMHNIVNRLGFRTATIERQTTFHKIVEYTKLDWDKIEENRRNNP